MTLPPYSAFPTVVADKIVLRQVLPADIPAIVEISFYDAKQARTIAEAIEMQAKIDQDYLAGNSIHWAIADRENNVVVGTCGYYRGFNQEKGELGCVLLPAFRGQGYMSAALKAAIEFGLNHIGLKRVIAITSKQNAKAIKLLDRLGFELVSDLSDDELNYELNNPKTDLYAKL